MVTPTSWMYVVDWGPWIWQMLCKSFAYDIERYFWRVVDSIWSFVVSETKTKWNVYCVARQYHDSRYVPALYQANLHSRRRACHPSRRVSSHFPLQQNEVWKRKWSVAQNNLKPFLCTSQWFCLLVSHTFSTIYQQPDSRILESSSWILFYLNQDKRFEHNSEISRKTLAVIFAMLTCLLWTFVNFFLILNTTAVIRNVNFTSGIVCVQSGWQLPVEAVLDLIVYLSKGITILQTKQRYREVTNINIS